MDRGTGYEAVDAGERAAAEGAQREHQRRRGVPVWNMRLVFLAGLSAGTGQRE